MRAWVVVAFGMDLTSELKLSEGTFDTKNTFVGYQGDFVYVVMPFADGEVMLLELDTKYQVCKYKRNPAFDLKHNEALCRELCGSNTWGLEQRAVESALYSLIND